MSSLVSRRGSKARSKKQARSYTVIENPREGEYPVYAERYIGLLPGDGMILNHFAENLASTRKFIASIPKTRLLYRYAEGSWLPGLDSN